MIVDPAATPVDRIDSGGVRLDTLLLSDVGGLTQFGAYVATLPPGAVSSRRHWHEQEDEFLYVLEGRATVTDDDGDHDLAPGDAACWRRGDPNAHHVRNLTRAPVRYIIVGSRVANAVCHYPDEKSKLVNGERTWHVVTLDGASLRGGDLPPELLNLAPAWGRPFDGSAARRILRKGEVAPVTGPSSYPAPYTLPEGRMRWSPISDKGGLTQFGAAVEELAPGAQSSQRHWHAAEDEFLYVLDGELTVVENDGDHRLGSGGAACWPAGNPNAHCLINRTGRPAAYLIVGSRMTGDECHYPDIDLRYIRKDGSHGYHHTDGTPYPGWPKRSET